MGISRNWRRVTVERVARASYQRHLRGAPEAKSSWPQRGMIEDITAGLDGVNVPAMIVIGDPDQVEHEEALRRNICLACRPLLKGSKASGIQPCWKHSKALAEVCKNSPVLLIEFQALLGAWPRSIQ